MPAQRLWDQNVWVRDTRRPSERDDRLSALRTWLPNGRLRVRAYSPYPMTTWSQDWLDAETKLEAQIDAIVTGIEAGACALPALIVTARQEYDEHRRKLAEEQRAWEIRQAREAYERATAASHEALLQMTHEWSQAEEIRRFLEAAEDDLVHVPDAVRAALAAKLKQARAMLGSQRPIDQLAAWTPPPRDPAR
jgi:hypothetical protein